MLECQPQKRKQIIQGSDTRLTIRLVTEEGEPMDLTGATEIKAILPNATGTTPARLEKTLSGGSIIALSSGGGKIQVDLTSTETRGLLIGVDLGLEVRVTIGGKVTIVQIPSAVDVIAPLYGY